jgi:hypothetical protein
MLVMLEQALSSAQSVIKKSTFWTNLVLVVPKLSFWCAAVYSTDVSDVIYVLVKMASISTLCSVSFVGSNGKAFKAVLAVGQIWLT